MKALCSKLIFNPLRVSKNLAGFAIPQTTLATLPNGYSSIGSSLPLAKCTHESGSSSKKFELAMALPLCMKRSMFFSFARLSLRGPEGRKSLFPKFLLESSTTISKSLLKLLCCSPSSETTMSHSVFLSKKDKALALSLSTTTVKPRLKWNKASSPTSFAVVKSSTSLVPINLPP